MEWGFVTILKSSSPFSSQALQEQVEVSKVENKLEKWLSTWSSYSKIQSPVHWSQVLFESSENDHYFKRNISSHEAAATLDTLNAFLHTPGHVCRAAIVITAEGNLEIQSCW